MTTQPKSVNQALYAHTRSQARARSTCADYARYEADKSIWVSQHPRATQAEYEHAMREIARKCGV